MYKTNNSHKKDKAVVGGEVKLIVLFRNWAHQGFFYLDKTEMFWRVVWELIPFSFFFYLFSKHICSLWFNLMLSLFVTHTINWVLNDNFWTCIQFTFPNRLNPGNNKTKKHLMGMQSRMQKYESIGGCMIYGSLSRGVWQDKSDLDVRVLRRKGVVNGLLAYLAVWRERLIALLKCQPLDIYLADEIDFLKRMRKDEYPIFLKANDDRLKLLYGEIMSEADLSVIMDINELANTVF